MTGDRENCLSLIFNECGISCDAGLICLQGSIHSVLAISIVLIFEYSSNKPVSCSLKYNYHWIFRSQTSIIYSVFLCHDFEISIVTDYKLVGEHFLFAFCTKHTSIDQCRSCEHLVCLLLGVVPLRLNWMFVHNRSCIIIDYYGNHLYYPTNKICLCHLDLWNLFADCFQQINLSVISFQLHANLY